MPDGWVSVVKVDEGEPFPVPTNCPYCGAPLVWVRTDDGPVYVFSCSRHGRLILGTDGRMKQQPQ